VLEVGTGGPGTGQDLSLKLQVDVATVVEVQAECGVWKTGLTGARLTVKGQRSPRGFTDKDARCQSSGVHAVLPSVSCTGQGLRCTQSVLGRFQAVLVHTGPLALTET